MATGERVAFHLTWGSILEKASIAGQARPNVITIDWATLWGRQAMLKEHGILKGNHDLAMQAQRERQAIRNAANAQAMARIEAHKARIAKGRTEVAIRALPAQVRAAKPAQESDKS